LGITGWMYIVFALMVLVIKECIDEFNINLHLSQSKSLLVQRLYVIGMVMIILCFGVLNGGQFIYFQF
jgi:alginate O-acetyltransferase complex protein AlgI